ncbi:uncharacterized protein [Dysidea avara]|uniref:uncharacterized protein n=1 Tax=Dysidea avara TaxID=196820 RepID=UPI00332CB9FB
MASNETEIANWTCEETARWASEHFSDDVVKRFEEKEVDGETLLMLGSCATMEMLNSCGLCTLKQQLLLRKLIAGSQASSSADTNPATSNSQNADPVGKNLTRNSKLTLHAMRSMKDMDKRMYLMKRNMVSTKAAEKWPGNNIPSFRNNKALQEVLTAFAKELAKDYSMDGFGEEAIRQHIKDCLHERKRQINQGYDYEKPPAKRSRVKKEKGSATKHADEIVKNDSGKQRVAELSTSKATLPDDYKVSSSQTHDSHDKLKVVIPSDEFSDSGKEESEESNGSKKKGKSKKVSNTPTSTAGRTLSHDKLKVVIPSDKFSDSGEEESEESNGSKNEGKSKKVSNTPTSTAGRTSSHDKLKVVIPSDEFSDSGEEESEESNGSTNKGKSKKVSDNPTSTAGRTLPPELTKQSATAVIFCAFSINNIRNVSRSQLYSAARLYCTSEEKKNLSKCDKKI